MIKKGEIIEKTSHYVLKIGKAFLKCFMILMIRFLGDIFNNKKKFDHTLFIRLRDLFIYIRSFGSLHQRYCYDMKIKENVLIRKDYQDDSQHQTLREVSKFSLLVWIVNRNN